MSVKSEYNGDYILIDRMIEFFPEVWEWNEGDRIFCII